jgi:hypothetical protein
MVFLFGAILLLTGWLARRPVITGAAAAVLLLGAILLLLDTASRSSSFREPWVMFWDHVVRESGVIR